MKLKDWIHKSGKKGYEVAKELGFCRDYIYKICKGSVKPTERIVNIINLYTDGAVKAKDLGYEKKEKCQCPTCGKWS